MLIKLNDLTATELLAKQIARLLKPPFTILLNGELGAGKTTLIRYILKSFGIEGSIKSPTFTLVEPYNLSDVEIYHFDLYRFSEPMEWLDSGFDEYFGDRSICLIEWPQRAQGLIPNIDWEITIAFKPDHDDRILDIIALTTKGKQCLELLQDSR